jgi:ribosomal protein L2
MKLLKTLTESKITLTKVVVTSGASRNTRLFKSDLPLQARYKKLLNCYKWKSGRGSRGSVVIWTKGRRTVKYKTPSINYKFRLTCLSFIGGFLLRPYSNKMIALLFLSTGSVSYVPTSTKHKLFQITQLKGTFFKYDKILPQLGFSSRSMLVDPTFFLIKQLPKNQPVSLLEIIPNRGVQYVRSSGSIAKILKMDSRVSTSLIKLPSGVKKVFSTHAIGSVGGVSLPESRRWSNSSAGYYKKFGKKSQVRGVAMNPVDHPHGGRAKAIRYQRTP